MALVFNRASDNYLFHGSQFKAGNTRDFLRLSTANNEAVIDLCNNSNIDISATDVFINGNRVVTSSGTSGSTLGSLEVTGTTVLQDLSAGATDISSTLNVAGAVTFDSTLDISGAIYIQDNQKAQVTIDYGNGSIITQRSAALIVEGGVIVKAPPTSSDAPATNPRIFSFISEGEGFFRGGLECENGITLFSGDIARYGYGTIYEASSNTIGNPTFDINAKNIDICGTLNVHDAVTLSSTLDVANAVGVTGTLAVTGATTLTGALGATTINASAAVGVDGDFDVATDKFTVASATGNTAVAGTLNVTGAVQIGSGANGTLTIGSGSNGGKIHSTETPHELVIDPFALDANGSIDASGVVTILGDLVVRGNTTTFHSENVDVSKNTLTLASGATSAGMADGAGITIGEDSYATFTFDSNNTKWVTNIDLDVSGALAVSGALSGATSIDGTGDLTMGTITMTGFSVDADGDTVTKSINNTNGGITDTGDIAGATDITGSGDLTMGTITMTGFSVDADGDTVTKSIDNTSGGITNTGAIAGATSIDGTGDLTMGTITMTGFSVDADGDTVTKSIDNTSGGITNTGAIAGATSIDGTGDLTMGTITMTGFSVDADGDTVTKSIDNTAGGITNTGAIAGATSIDGTGDLTMGTITMTGFSVDADGDTVTKSLSLAGNLTTTNTTAQIPVTKSTFALKKSGFSDMSASNLQNEDWHDATGYNLNKTLLSANSFVKMEFKVNFISSPEADQTLSFRVRRTVGDTHTNIFTDENIGSNMGVTIRNVYNGTYIDEPGASSVTYQLQFKRNGGSEIDTPFGVLGNNSGDYIFLQELYVP